MFANIYLHELDRFVRHTVKPLAYVRYGDDVVLFVQTKQQALQVQAAIADWLWRELCLPLHATNGGVFKVSSGIYFLGHRIYPGSVTLAPSTAARMRRHLHPGTVASYRAQRLSRAQRRAIPWLILLN